MKRFIAVVLSIVLSLGIPATVVAADLTGCNITVDAVSAAPGDTVTVAVRISDNPGFTNFAIALDYDETALKLIRLDTVEEDTPYLCGGDVSTNTAWEGEAGKTFGYVVAASATPVKENGILFTATFTVEEDFTGVARVDAQVQYIRNNEAVFSIFEQIHGNVTAGYVSTARIGDVNADGIVEYNDVMLAYRAYLGEAVLTEEQMITVDRNGNGTVEEAEYQAVYQAYIGG